jgi:hypothetical protein
MAAGIGALGPYHRAGPLPLLKHVERKVRHWSGGCRSCPFLYEGLEVCLPSQAEMLGSHKKETKIVA